MVVVFLFGVEGKQELFFWGFVFLGEVLGDKAFVFDGAVDWRCCFVWGLKEIDDLSDGYPFESTWFYHFFDEIL